jgi:MFS family permease
VKLLRQHDFLLLFISLGLSHLGDLLAALALTIRVHDTTGSGWAVSALLLAELLPLVLLAPLAGMLVDRFETVRVLAVAVTLQAIVAVGLAFAGSMSVLLLLALLLGAGAAVANPAIFALVPRVAGEDHITEANAYLELARYGGATLGPLLGGALSAALGVRTALLIDAATFVVVGVAAVALRVRRRPVAEPSAEEAVGRRVRAMREGFMFLARDRLLRIVALAHAAMLLFAGAENVAFVFFVKDVLHAGDAGFGIFVATWTLGMVAGIVLVGRRIRVANLALAYLLAMLFGRAAVTLAGALPFVLVALPAFLSGGGGNGIENVTSRSLIHHRSPENLRGRVFAAWAGLGSGAQIAAMALGGAIVELAGPRGTILFAGLGGVLVAVAALIAIPRWSPEPAQSGK